MRHCLLELCLGIKNLKKKLCLGMLPSDRRINSCWSNKSKTYGYKAELVLFILSSRQFFFFGCVILHQEKNKKGKRKKEMLALRVTGTQERFPCSILFI